MTKLSQQLLSLHLHLHFHICSMIGAPAAKRAACSCGYGALAAAAPSVARVPADCLTSFCMAQTARAPLRARPRRRGLGRDFASMHSSHAVAALRAIQPVPVRVTAAMRWRAGASRRRSAGAQLERAARVPSRGFAALIATQTMSLRSTTALRRAAPRLRLCRTLLRTAPLFA